MKNRSLHSPLLLTITTVLFRVFKCKNSPVLLLLILINLPILAQSKKEYLRSHREDMLSRDFRFSEKDFKIIGFGAYHGSAKTYEAELALLSSLMQQGLIKYYLPETNFSQAYFLNQYLQSGDTTLLKKLTLGFETIVNQEGSIETYRHWQNIKKLNDSLPESHKIQVIGVDVVAEYRFPILHLLELANVEEEEWKLLQELDEFVTTDTTSLRTSRDSLASQLLKQFTEDYQAHKPVYQQYISDTTIFNHVIMNIEHSLSRTTAREQIIFDNYVALSDRYRFNENKQFAKYGFSHLLKSEEGSFSPFFSRLAHQLYKPHQVITVMGYLTQSEVLWDKIYDEEGRYQTYTTEQGYGIGDYWKEYFEGIKHFKRTRLSDITIYRLNGPHTPYQQGDDLLKVHLFLKKSTKHLFKGKATTDFIDYAVLISNSEAQTPIEEMRLSAPTPASQASR